MKNKINKGQLFEHIQNEVKKIIKENMEIERVYLNRDLSDYFDVPYSGNDGVETIINSGTLKNKNHSWDNVHLSLFDKYAGKDLRLKGDGFGWWKIIQGLGESKFSIRKVIRKTLEENYAKKDLIKENINIGDTVTNNNQFYKVISEPFTAMDNGLAQFARDNNGASPPNDVDLRSYYTAIKVKNIDTGNESSGKISWFKKVNPEDIEGLKQSKLSKDDADKAEREARRIKDIAEREEKQKRAEVERLQSIANSDIDKNDVINALNDIFTKRAYDYNEKEFWINPGNDVKGYIEFDSTDEDGNTINTYKLDYVCNIEVNEYPSYDRGDRWTPPSADDGEIDIELNKVSVSKWDIESKDWSTPINFGKDNSLFPEALKREIEEDLNEEYWKNWEMDGPDGD